MAGGSVLFCGAVSALCLFLGWQHWQLRQTHQKLRQKYLLQSEYGVDPQGADPSLTSVETGAAQVLALDYLRMRMDEEIFRFSLLNQIESNLTQLFTQTLDTTGVQKY